MQNSHYLCTDDDSHSTSTNLPSMMSKSTSEPKEPDEEVQESAWSQPSAVPEKTSAVDNSQHPSSQSADDSLPIGIISKTVTWRSCAG